MTGKFGDMDDAARTVTESELRAEARDAFTYHKSEQGKREVEMTRLAHLADSAPTVHTFIISKCAVAAEAPGLLMRLAKALLKEGDTPSAVDDALALEGDLKERAPLLREEAAKAGSTAHSIVEAVLKDRPASDPERGAGGAGEDADTSALSSRAVEAAILRPAFRAMAVAVRNAGSGTKREKIAALAYGFDGSCPIAVRALCSKKPVSRHPTLLQLFDLRGYIPDYLS
ncbi:MAG: hypothetical protein SGPRY_011026 [Prymnesium sp.]